MLFRLRAPWGAKNSVQCEEGYTQVAQCVCVLSMPPRRSQHACARTGTSPSYSRMVRAGNELKKPYNRVPARFAYGLGAMSCWCWRMAAALKSPCFDSSAALRWLRSARKCLRGG